ncbi:MAG: Gfo/Idh/MocA family oxidoreductase [Burkholderiales bacterium]|nr:Gfo/Idh/MocA family oxidoreductase [Opitutaceae bacterium]
MYSLPPATSATHLRRRAFLKTALTAGAVSLLAPRTLWGASPDAPAILQAVSKQKVKLACIGIGNRGGDIIRALNATGLAEIVALCDTDMGAPHTEKTLNAFPGVPRFQDFRQMFDKMGKDIEAVSVGTPDFSHFPITMLAMSLGKHVYCEKPMAHSFRQTELMMAAEAKYKVAAQMGNQGHSEENYFQFKAWTEAGIITNVTKITAFMNNSRRWHGKTYPDYLPEEPVPATLDWDCWLATAETHRYNKGYQNGEWRSWFDFGNGALGDWGAHMIDTAHEFLALGLPTEVNPTLEGYSPLVFPQASTLEFKFPARGALPPVDLTWYDGQKNLPELPENYGDAIVDGDIPPPTAGANDTKKLIPGKVLYSETLTFKGGTHAKGLQILPSANARDIASRLPEVPKTPSNHFANFLLACQGREKTRSNFAVAGPLCQAMALGIIAQRVNSPLKFDATTRRITNHALANALLDGPPPRGEWAQYYKL